MAREPLPPHRRGEKGPLGSNNAMVDTDTSAEHHAVKKDEQARDKPSSRGEHQNARTTSSDEDRDEHDG